MKTKTGDRQFEPGGSAGSMTAEEFWDLGEEKRHCELVRGAVVEMTPASGEHGALETNLAILVGGFVKRNKLGVVTTGETGHVISRDPDTVRAPDLGFVFQKNIPTTGVPRKFWEIPPDLAIEIISPSDTYTAVVGKTDDWLKAGSREVWVVDPSRRAVTIHARDHVREVGLEDTLENTLLPGFSVAGREIFDV